MLKDKNILYIVHSYHSFQKDSIEALAKEFKNVYVIVRYKPFAEISKIFPISILNIHRKEHVIQEEGKPGNVHIFTAPLWYLPFRWFYKYLGKYHYKVVDRVIKRNKIKFNIIHSHFTWTSGYVGMRLKEKYGVPFILNIHSSNVLEEQLRLKEKEIIATWKKADAIIKVNKENIEDLKDYNKETYFIPNGFNNKLFFLRDQIESRKSLDIDLEKKILLSVGHLNECKGQIFLIHAIGELVNTRGIRNLKLYLIGEGVLRIKLEKEIKDLGLEDFVVLLGKRLHKEVPLWMNACDVFVLPSLSESFGIVQLEAFSCGKPVVATSTLGSKQLMQSDDLGFLCRVGDAKDLADKIVVATNKNWSESKILKYSQNYTWDIVVKDFLSIYNKVLKEKND